MTDQDDTLMRRLLHYATKADRDPATAPRLCAESHTLIEKLAQALKDVEWAGNDPGLSGRCPQCAQKPADGHKPRCTLTLALIAASLAGAVS